LVEETEVSGENYWRKAHNVIFLYNIIFVGCCPWITVSDGKIKCTDSLFYCRNDVVLPCWCLTSLSTIFQLYRGGQLYWWRKPRYLEKTTDEKHITLFFSANLQNNLTFN
jgi:hypothetical protein